jgi:diamine N-acetyltransferase
MALLNNGFIKLRALEPEDLEVLYRWENDTELWTVGNTITPYSRYQLREFISSANQDIFTSKQLRLMIELEANGETAGCIDLYEFDVFHRKAAVGIMVDGKSRNRGIAMQALELLAAYAFSFLKLNQLYCYIPEYNKASIKLFEKAGFTPSGRLTNWIRTGDGYSDVFIYQLPAKRQA